jgi:tripartite-type tricarboxylate transporter receptor subunit TctC
VSYYAFYARAGTPRDIMERFAADTGEAVKTPEFAEKLGKAFNITPLGLGPDESSRLLGEEDQRMRRVAARAGIKPQ